MSSPIKVKYQNIMQILVATAMLNGWWLTMQLAQLRQPEGSVMLHP